MKRVLVVFALLGAAVLLTASQQDKLDWCHFPPGQWTGNPATSKVLILSISEDAISGHLNHQGDGPVNFEPDYPSLTPLGSSCGAGSCSLTTCSAINTGGSGVGTITNGVLDDSGVLVPLVVNTTKCQCVCPASVQEGMVTVTLSGGGSAPAPAGGTGPLTCGLTPS